MCIYDSEVNRLEIKLDHLTNSLANTKDLTRKFIVKSLPETEGESLNTQIYDLISSGLNINDVEIDGVERKARFIKNVPGVVIITCKT